MVASFYQTHRAGLIRDFPGSISHCISTNTACIIRVWHHPGSLVLEKHTGLVLPEFFVNVIVSLSHFMPLLVLVG